MQAMGEPVEHLQDRFSAGTLDEEWMPKIAGVGLIVVTTDRRIYDRDAQRKIARDCGLVFFVLPTGFEQQKSMRQLELLAKYWPGILAQAARVNAGDFWLIQQNAKMELGSKK